MYGQPLLLMHFQIRASDVVFRMVSRLVRSISWSVGRSVGGSVNRSVGRSIVRSVGQQPSELEGIRTVCRPPEATSALATAQCMISGFTRLVSRLHGTPTASLLN